MGMCMWLIPRWVVDLWVVAEDILVEIVVVLYEMLFNMGCEEPCKHCCSLWVEVISFSPLCGLGDK